MYKIFEELLNLHGITAYKVAKETGISTSTLTEWKKGKYVPKADKLQKIADYFGVPLEYLMTGKTSDKKSPASSETELKGVYFNFAKEAQESGIDPDDIKLAIETIKKLRGEK